MSAAGPHVCDRFSHQFRLAHLPLHVEASASSVTGAKRAARPPRATALRLVRRETPSVASVRVRLSKRLVSKVAPLPAVASDGAHFSVAAGSASAVARSVVALHGKQ